MISTQESINAAINYVDPLWTNVHINRVTDIMYYSGEPVSECALPKGPRILNKDIVKAVKRLRQYPNKVDL